MTLKKISVDKGYKLPDDITLKCCDINIRTQCFSEKIPKRNLKYFHSICKDLTREYLVVWKFIIEVPKSKEHVLICIITVKKVCDLLLILLQVIAILAYA